MIKDNRFQNQKWYIKLWRFRWYGMIPFMIISMFFRVKGKYSIKTLIKLAKGLVQLNMNWIYTWDEVKERRKK